MLSPCPHHALPMLSPCSRHALTMPSPCFLSMLVPCSHQALSPCIHHHAPTMLSPCPHHAIDMLPPSSRHAVTIFQASGCATGGQREVRVRSPAPTRVCCPRMILGRRLRGSIVRGLCQTCICAVWEQGFQTLIFSWPWWGFLALA